MMDEFNNKMKKFLPILMLLYSLVVGFRIAGGEPEVKEPTTGYIDITVESNINKIFFTYAFNEGSVFVSGSSLLSNNNASLALITVPVREFKCINQYIYHDFLTLLKASQYPNLTITLPQKFPLQYQTTDSVILHGVMINIAGVSRIYDIPCYIEYLNQKDIALIGTAKIRLTDLEIEPPVKSLGLVKIKNEIIVKFGLRLDDYNLNLAISE
jgi:hypothetical protein